jgi:ABC-2 type transport system permease protein
MRASVAIGLRVIRQLTRDRRTIAMILVVPLIITLLFGFALQGETHHNPIIVVNEGPETPLKTAFIAELGTDDRTEIKEVSSDLNASWDKLKAREVSALVVLPSQLGTGSDSTELNITIQVFADEAEPSVRASVLAAVNGAMASIMRDSNIPVKVSVVSEPVWGTGELSGLDVSLPGVIGFIIMFLVLLLSLLLLVREDLEGTKFRFYAAPVNRWQIMSGYVLGMTFFAVLISLVVLLVSIVVFGAAVRGSLLVVIGFVILFAIGTIMLAILLSRLARNEFQAVQLAPMIAIPSIALSGFLVPVQTLPTELQVVAQFIPLTYAIDGLKTVMLRGGGVGDITVDLVALLIYMIVAFVGAVLSSKETVA